MSKYFQISAVKSCKDEVCPQLKTFEPKKQNTLGEFVKEFELQKQKDKFGGFMTAAELEMSTYSIIIVGDSSSQFIFKYTRKGRGIPKNIWMDYVKADMSLKDVSTQKTVDRRE